MFASIAASVKNEPVFKQFDVLRMRKNMRADNDEIKFAEWLCDVGAGKNHVAGSSEIELPETNIANSSEELINFCFLDLFNARNPLDKSETIADAAILAPTNDNVSAINNRALHLLPGEIETFTSIDTPLGAGIDYTSIYKADNNIETIYNSTPSGLPPHILELKVLFFLFDIYQKENNFVRVRLERLSCL